MTTCKYIFDFLLHYFCLRLTFRFYTCSIVTERVTSVNLEHFFQPHLFLTSFQQTCSRLLHCPMNEIRLLAQVITKNPKTMSNDFYFDIHGLFIQGATVYEDSSGDLILREVDVETPVVMPVPPIRMSFIRTNAFIIPNSNSANGLLLSSSVPLYLSMDRHEILCDVQVQHDKPKDPEWPLLSGVAFLVNTS